MIKFESAKDELKIGDVAVTRQTAAPGWGVITVSADPTLVGIRFETVNGDVKTMSAKDVLAAAETVAAPLAQPKKRGRPIAPKPWEAEGISRMTWHRRQKAKQG